MEINFLRPLFLILLLAIPLLWFFPRRIESRTQGILRSLLLLALVIALARPVLLAPDKEAFQVFILDDSDSITPSQQQRGTKLLEQWLAQVKDMDKSTMIVINGSAQQNK